MLFQSVGLSAERDRSDGESSSHILDIIPETAGARAKISRGGFLHSLRGPGEHEFRADAHFVAVMLAPSPGMESTLGSDKTHAYDAPYGMIVVNPAGVDSRARWSSTRENIVVAITPESLEELAAHEFDLGRAELRPPPFGTVDLQAVRLAELMVDELHRNGPVNEVYADSLLVVFGIHLLREYSGADAARIRPKGGLTTTAARRVQEYVEEHFTRRLSVAELAAICELSPGHFIQSFTKSFGEPPHRYIINRRLDFAERLLVEGKLTIAEIAYLSGFSSQSHLTSAMKKYRHTTPAQVRTKR